MNFTLISLCLFTSKQTTNASLQPESPPISPVNNQNNSTTENETNLNSLLNVSHSFINAFLGYCETGLKYLDSKEGDVTNGEDIKKIFSGLQKIQSDLDKDIKKENWILSVYHLVSGVLKHKGEDKSTNSKESTNSKVKNNKEELSNKEETVEISKFISAVPENRKWILILEILEGKFDNVPTNLYIEDCFIDYLLDNVVIKTKEEYNNVSKLLHRVKDHKELTNKEKIKNMVSDEYISFSSPVHKFFLPLARFFINRHDLIFKMIMNLEDELHPQEEVQASS